MAFPSPVAAARIVADAAIYRAKKREAGNLVTSTTLALAIALPLRDVAHRVIFGLVLNLFVYLVNDCFDVDVDQQAAGRDHDRTRFLAAHLASGWLGVVGLGAIALVVAALHSRGLLFVFGVNVVIIVLYSRWLKRMPLVDLLCMAAWGVSMALVGTPLDHVVGLKLVGLLGLLCVVTEGVQVVRDEPTDRASSVRTTAVVLGVTTTAIVTRVMIVVSAAYTMLVLHRFFGVLLLFALIPPLRTETASRTWDLLRALFGLTWLGIVVWLRLTGHLLPLLG